MLHPFSSFRSLAVCENKVVHIHFVEKVISFQMTVSTRTHNPLVFKILIKTLSLGSRNTPGPNPEVLIQCLLSPYSGKAHWLQNNYKYHAYMNGIYIVNFWYLEGTVLTWTLWVHRLFWRWAVNGLFTSENVLMSSLYQLCIEISRT